MSWNIDPIHTHLNFSARHMMISTVRGEFKRFTGSVNFNPDNPEATTTEITIDVNSVDTGVEDRDNHLRSADFFDVENYPHMTFKSTGVEVIDATHAKLAGDLTIRGVSKPVTLDVEYFGTGKTPFGTMAAGFSATTKVNRKDWGLTWNVALETGGILVGDEITINIEAEFSKPLEAELTPEAALEAA